MIHGTHYQATSRDAFAPGKVWGPWLWYLNSGSKTDALTRSKQEDNAWPYKWFKDPAYQSRGKLQGRLLLSDGRPASGAAVFLGDNNNASISTLDQGQNYYYTTYADAAGKFSLRDIRTGAYALYARPNGGAMSDVLSNFTSNDVEIRDGKNTNLKDLTWRIADRAERIFQVGALDRQSNGFARAGPTPFEHGRIAKCPANLTYTVPTSREDEWCFAQSALGTWSIAFPLPTVVSDAKLTVSLAGFSSGSEADVLVNGKVLGKVGGADILNSQDTYRGATRAGEWRKLEFMVGKGELRVGANEVSFRVTKTTLWRGWVWDAVVLKWV
jgi:rhamnogalacturonan endolyase